MFGVQRSYKYRLVQAARAQTSGHGEQALPEASGLLIRLSREGTPHRPSFPPRTGLSM